MFKKILINKDKKYFVKNTDEDFHTQFGSVKKADLKKNKGRVKTNKGYELFIIKPRLRDLFEKAKRGPQTIRLKDMAVISAELGINKKSFVLDAGTGSGFMAIFLSSIAKKVVSYEKRKEFFKVAEQNKELFQVKNLKLVNDDVVNVKEKNFDAVSLDLPEPFEALKSIIPRVKVGAFISVYLPQIDQVKDLVMKIEKYNNEHEAKIIQVKTIEVLQREWIVDKRRLMPKNVMLGHTAFITILRRVL